MTLEKILMGILIQVENSPAFVEVAYNFYSSIKNQIYEVDNETKNIENLVCFVIFKTKLLIDKIAKQFMMEMYQIS